MAAVEEKTAPGKGVGLFATRALAQGELLLDVPEPEVAVPDDAHIAETCAWCFAWRPRADGMWYGGGAGLATCTRCKTLRYCNTTCQRADWPTHKRECRIFSTLHPRVLPASVRATLRLLLLGTALPALPSHVASFAGTPKWPDIVLMARGAHRYSATSLAEPAVLELYCTLLVNTVRLATPTLDPVGLYLSARLARANHSCDPNATIVFRGRAAQLRTLRAVRAGEEVCIAYVDHTAPRHIRLRELQQRYFFACGCAACRVGVRESYRHACGGEVPAETEVLVCAGCDGVVGVRRGELRRVEEEGMELAERGGRGELEARLREVYGLALFPVHRQPVPALHAAIVQRLLEERSYYEAMRHQLLLYSLVDPVVYPANTHPVRVVRGFVLAVLMIEVMRERGTREGIDWPRAVWGVLKEVEGGVGGSHGEDSGFAAVVREKVREVREELVNGGVRWALEEKVDMSEVLAQASKVVTDLRREFGDPSV